MSELQSQPTLASEAPAPHTLHVLVSTPAHAGLPEVLSYRADQAWPAGTLVRVPLGARELLGVVWQAQPPARPPRLRQQPHRIAPRWPCAP